MKKPLLLSAAGLFGVHSFSQATISNSSFETWGNVVVKDSLDDWNTSTVQYQNQGILDVTNASAVPGYLGGTALHLETILWTDPGTGLDDTLFGYSILGNANGPDFLGIPYTDTVDVF